MVLTETQGRTAAGEDPVAQGNAFGDDEVEAAIEQIDAFEAKHCDIEKDSGPGDGASHDIDPEAARVDVVTRDYSFEVPPTIAAGPTSFVAINEGAEAHFLGLGRLAEGATLERALQSQEDPNPLLDGDWSTRVASAGRYGMVCFIAGPDGQPHAFQGMQCEFTVT